MNSLFRHLLLALGTLLLSATAAHAQYQLSPSVHFNHLTLSTTKLGAVNNNPATQFSSVGITSTGAGPLRTADPKYPQSTTTNAQNQVTVAVVMTSARIGNSYASGVPRYYLGDIIPPPPLQADNVTPAAPGYWRVVRSTDVFTGGTLVKAGSGDPLTAPVWTLTPDQEAFYYSPHAKAVFAKQAGTVEIMWVTSTIEGGQWKFLKETFNVSGGSQYEVKKIFWTEKSFDAPRVIIPNGSIDRVNPVYSASFPDLVASEYVPVGFVPNPDPNGQLVEERRTLWFDKIAGTASLSAYNLEGRILIEYLGNETTPGVYEFLGADVVEVARRATATVVTTKLGQRLLPHVAMPPANGRTVPDADTPLIPFPVQNLTLGGDQGYFDSQFFNDGRQTYWAERENLSPSRVVFYWLEEGEASIRLPGAAPTGVAMEWPQFKNLYKFVWPEFDEFAHVTTDPGGSSAATGLQFDPTVLPEIIFQDDGSQIESSLDSATQRLVVDFSASGDNWNRTLLKFSTASAVWYQTLYTQAEDRQGYQEADGGPALAAGVLVGARIAPPSAKYSLAGHISAGTGYQASAYIDPYTAGVVPAEAGAIIPVNARPTDNELTVRWFEKISPPAGSTGFSAFYVPSKSGRYTVSYPDPVGDWKTLATMNLLRNRESMTLLLDGRVLVAGGVGTGGVILDHAELYNPATNTWTTTTPMNTASYGHSAVRLADGKVLVIGGGSFGIPHLTPCEVFDPTTETWTTVGSISGRSGRFAATPLQNGKVLLTGGEDPDTGFLIATTLLYDPTTQAWSAGPNMLEGHGEHQAILLNSGKVLIYGGYDASWGTPIKSELYDPVSNSWAYTAGDPVSGSELLKGIKLGNGKVFVQSYDSSQLYAPKLYDPVANNWSTTTSPAGFISDGASLAALPDGRLLLAGGPDKTTTIYNPVTATWTVGPPMQGVHRNPNLFTLANGQILAVAGLSYSLDPNALTTELLDNRNRIVMASNEGTENLSAAQAAGYIYQQNNPASIGFNPNEEHAVKKDGRFWALRDDLNVTTEAGYTSDPFVLVAYTDPQDGRPAMRPFRVLRETEQYPFNYGWTAGMKIQGPMPLPLLQLPKRNGVIANTEVPGTPDEAPADTAPAAYDRFTLEDRQGYKWVYRGIHDGGSPGGTFGMQWYYPMDKDFYIPGVASQPVEGTALPYLRPLADGVPQGDAVNGDAFTVIYRPQWPENVPSMRVAETLTLPKFGLPDVRNQKSAEIPYQQSIAINGAAKTSVTLHDPTRQKAVSLAAANLTDGIPESIRTSVYQGKTYFQGLPPHLQTRFYFDPLASATGSLVFKGQFFDEIAGEDYLDLNVLTSEDEDALVALADNESVEIKNKWINAIQTLRTQVETFIEDPARKGSYKVSSDPAKTFPVGPKQLAVMPDSDTARDSYALTATGQGVGYVTLLFSDGEVPTLTPAGDSPVMKIIKVLPELYKGDLKVRLSTNPLDEKVTLRHSGDFAARPEDYEFEWQWAPPTQEGTQPPTYTYTKKTYLGDPANSGSRAWKYVFNPAVPHPEASAYSLQTLALATSVIINNASHDPASGLPGLILKAADELNFASGIPAQMVFSADTDSLTGFALYVNGSVALVHGNGVAALDALISENAYDLRLVRTDSIDNLPVEGESLVVVAEISGKLHFRVFNSAGGQVFDAAEGALTGKSAEISDLRSRLSSLWATTNLPASDKAAVVSAAAGITEVNLDQNGSVGLVAGGLSKQFRVDGSYFVKGLNRIEVAFYSDADAGVPSTINVRLDGATKTDQVLASGSPWAKAIGDPLLMNRAVIGGSPTAPLGSPLLVMSDNYFTMRYRPLKTRGNILATGYATQNEVPWSDWARPALVEGWIKRVLAAINPFNQRMTDLYNNAVNTDVSLLTQAGTKWEGDIALTLDAINDTGLISIYETVLNRGKGISIGSGYDYGPANDALLLAAGYLSDLYTILGDEAYADAANPTISLDDQDTITEVNTSRFSFEGQVASSLDEELGLLRGRDDFLNPQVTQSPFYNRLFWNYTRGINSGEALYAVNYNIKEKVGSSTANGSIDVADAQRMFPQGHGDAYGHYLSALKGYYKLLTNPNFTWVPRIESLNIAGNTVSVDYQDERKFAEDAAKVASTAQQVVALTHRQQYHDEPADGWAHFRDGETGGEFNDARHWGLDEWASRSGQGAYYHWVVGNAMVKEEETELSGIQKIDRIEVRELQSLAVAGDSFQTTLDNANAHLNPLGLSPGAIAFDISPAELRAGNSHYEQVYGRALNAALNAKGSFDQAGRMTRLLRNQQNQIDDFNTAVEEEERGFNYKLIDLFGSPYPGDVGPGRTYAQGYDGPDLYNWFLLDRPSGVILDTTKTTTINLRVPTGVAKFHSYGLIPVEIPRLYLTFYIPSTADLRVTALQYAAVSMKTTSITVDPDQFAQFVDVVYPSIDMGKRAITGRLQQVLNDSQMAHLSLLQAEHRLQDVYSKFDRQSELVTETLKYHASLLEEMKSTGDSRAALLATYAAAEILSQVKKGAANTALYAGEVKREAQPLVNGVGGNDLTSITRGMSLAAARIVYAGLSKTSSIAELTAQVAKASADALGSQLQRALDGTNAEGYEFEQKQLVYEFEQTYNEMARQMDEFASLALKLQTSAEAVRTVLAEGDRLMLEREIYRKRAATIVQGYRTKDLTFRVFRNEALEQYRTLFDLASRYTYLAAKSYDYETGLLGTPQGQAVFADIVASRALGDLANGVPQATVSTLGDAGLAGTMARMNADFSVAEGRLGINNPDQNGTLFSLRRELYRLPDNPNSTADDEAWQQTLEQHFKSDVMLDRDVAAQCSNIRKPDGSPVPGIIMEFGSTIQHGLNFFGLGSAAGDHNYSPSNFATKIFSVGVVLPGYVGMDPYAFGSPGAGSPNTNGANTLNATPYVYLIPVGMDRMLAPPLGDTNTVRSWKVDDQALPLPYNLGATAFNSTQFFTANGTLSEQPWILRKHQAFRPVDDPAFFYSLIPQEFTSSRLIGRSVWNTTWKIVIPAYSLLQNEQEGLNRFAATVKDIQIFLRTYSNSGN